MSKYIVQCPVCCGSFHEMTKSFDKNRPANGAMFTLRKEYKAAGWESFPEHDNTEYANVVCPSCGACYLDSNGRVIRPQLAKKVEAPADIPTDTPPDTTPAETGSFLGEVIATIKKLNPDDPAHWTIANKPDARVLTDLLNKRVTAKLRDEAWGKVQA